VHRFGDGSTAIALAFLDQNNDASYSFYKEYPANRLDIAFPEISKDDIVQCGSFYAIWPEIRDRFRNFINSAAESGALILYDPNFRKSHLSDLGKLKPLVIDNMRMSGIIRGSDEDFFNIFGVKTPTEAWNEVNKYCGTLVYTANKDGVFVKTHGFSGQFPVKKINPVSTIGAGDNFNAGMIASIYHKNIGREDLEKLKGDDWLEIIGAAVDFASEVCMSYENYISMEFAQKFRKSVG
jgi:fructokinase